MRDGHEGWEKPTGTTGSPTTEAVDVPSAQDAEGICRQVRCPVLVVHGDQDGIVPYDTGVSLAGWTGGTW